MNKQNNEELRRLFELYPEEVEYLNNRIREIADEVNERIARIKELKAEADRLHQTPLRLREVKET